MSAGRWQERASLGLGPGIVRFNDANLIMLRIAAGVVVAAAGQEAASSGRALHLASQGRASSGSAAARALQATALQAIDVFAQHDFDDERTCARCSTPWSGKASKGEYVDYVVAEQTTMAIGTIVQAMRDAGVISEAEAGRVEAVMDEMYAGRGGGRALPAEGGAGRDEAGAVGGALRPAAARPRAAAHGTPQGRDRRFRAGRPERRRARGQARPVACAARARAQASPTRSRNTPAASSSWRRRTSCRGAATCRSRRRAARACSTPGPRRSSRPA